VSGLILTKEQAIINYNDAHRELADAQILLAAVKKAAMTANFSVMEVNRAYYRMFLARKNRVDAIEKAMSAGWTLDELGVDRRRLDEWRDFQNIDPQDVTALIDHCGEDKILTDATLRRIYTESTTEPPTRNYKYKRGKMLEYMKQTRDDYECPNEVRRMIDGWIEVLDGE